MSEHDEHGHEGETHEEHAEHAEESTGPLQEAPGLDSHGHSGEGFVEEFVDLLTNPAHWAFEITGEVLSGAIMYPIIRLVVTAWVKRHDAKVHGK